MFYQEIIELSKEEENIINKEIKEKNGLNDSISDVKSKI